MTPCRFFAKPLAACACLLLLALSLAAPVVTAAAPQKWTIVPLGSLGPRGSIALTLNNRGDVGGYSAAVPPGTTNWYFHAFVWQDGTMIDLGAQLGSPSGQSFSQVSALNDRGTAVVNGYQGMSLWRDGQWTSLGFFGAVSDINNKDVVVGSYSFGLGGHAYRYSDGVMRDLGTLGGAYSSAGAINDKGVIVGTSYLAGDGATRGFVWENGTMTPIPTIGGLSSGASDINSHGVIVGNAQDASGVWHAVHPRQGRHAGPVQCPVRQHAVRHQRPRRGPRHLHERQQPGHNLIHLGRRRHDGARAAARSAGGRWRSLFVIDLNDRGWITGWGWKVGGSPDGEAFLLMPR